MFMVQKMHHAGNEHQYLMCWKC